MVTNRRNFILGAGGSLALSFRQRDLARDPYAEKAIEPWQLDPDPPADARMDAFRHAILAPNPHNRQPWLIQLEGNDSAIISCDLDKRLPETDPLDRQIVIGFGRTFLSFGADCRCRTRNPDGHDAVSGGRTATAAGYASRRTPDVRCRQDGSPGPTLQSDIGTQDEPGNLFAVRTHSPDSWPHYRRVM